MSMELLIELFSVLLVRKGCCHDRASYVPVRYSTAIIVPSSALSSLRASKTTGLFAVEKVESWWSVLVTRWRQCHPRETDC